MLARSNGKNYVGATKAALIAVLGLGALFIFLAFYARGFVFGEQVSPATSSIGQFQAGGQGPERFWGVGGVIGPDALQQSAGDAATVQEKAFLGLNPPALTTNESAPDQEIIEYAVQDGETVTEIARSFGVSVNSVLWANNISSGSLIRSGQILLIPPVSGVLHTVREQDNCKSIADRYGASEEKLVDFNNLGQDCKLFAGEVVIVPDGRMPSVPAGSLRYTQALAPTADGFFVFPTTGRITQGLHPVNAVDIGNACGTSVLAAAAGTVEEASMTASVSRYANRGYGNFIKIKHTDAISTMYTHLLAALVGSGAEVKQGQLIALMGGEPLTPGAGRTTGCHLHFEVRGARNPFAR